MTFNRKHRLNIWSCGCLNDFDAELHISRVILISYISHLREQKKNVEKTGNLKFWKDYELCDRDRSVSMTSLNSKAKFSMCTWNVSFHHKRYFLLFSPTWRKEANWELWTNKNAKSCELSGLAGSERVFFIYVLIKWHGSLCQHTMLNFKRC